MRTANLHEEETAELAAQREEWLAAGNKVTTGASCTFSDGQVVRPALYLNQKSYAAKRKRDADAAIRDREFNNKTKDTKRAINKF